MTDHSAPASTIACCPGRQSRHITQRFGPARAAILWCCLFWLCPVMPGHAVDIDVFTTDSFSFDQSLLQAYGVRTLYNIDDFTRVERALNADLPANEQQARAIATQRLQQQHKALAHSFKGALLVDQLDLFALPAIVFEQGRAVYYGHDVAKAVAAWNHYVSQ